MFRCFVLNACLLLVITGCGASGPEIASVEGKVTMDGQPLANAAVVFVPENGRPSGARTNAQGEYELTFTEGRRGATPGKYKVRITTLSDTGFDDDGQSTPGSPETVPMQFNASTTLTFEVVANTANVANFEITSEGDLPDNDDTSDTGEDDN
ncbi:MAG TPA: carboxypeptidase regulatory-like domain-containing protein [Planctomycetes bacterium]|nr:carboxypeptidase regulatory-like domain-containing protein [Planctomycetota bacterium]